MFLKLAIVSLVFVISVAHGNCAAITTVEIPTTPGVIIPYNPGTLPCKKNGSNLTEQQFDDMLMAFRVVSDASSKLRNKAELQYDTSQQEKCYFNLRTAFEPPTADPSGTKGELLQEFVQYYYNMTRIAYNTSITLAHEEQRDLALDAFSLYSSLDAMKEKLHQGTKLLKMMLNAEGYGCVADQFPSIMANTPVRSDCDDRYVRLVTVIHDIHETARHLANGLNSYQQQDK